jgi:hypothetical protein
MFDRNTQPSCDRPSARRRSSSDEPIPTNRRYDLTEFLLPQALDEEATERWIVHQQLPGQLRGLGLEFALHDILRRRWFRLMEHLSAGLMCTEEDTMRVVRISNLMAFQIHRDTRRIEAGFVDHNCFRWFSFDVIRPLSTAGLIGRLMRSEFTYELALPEHLLSQPLPAPPKGERWRCSNLKYFPMHAFDYAGTRIVRRMRRLFQDRPFNDLLCRALALDRKDLLSVLRARPARTQRFVLHSFFWDLCMLRRDHLLAVAAARPLLLPLFGAILLESGGIPEAATPESLLHRLSIYPNSARFRYERNPEKPGMF